MESDTVKKIFKYLDKPLLVTTVLLFIIGLIMVFSASNVTAYMSHEVSPYNYFIKQAVFLFITINASCSSIDCKNFFQHKPQAIILCNKIKINIL